MQLMDQNKINDLLYVHIINSQGSCTFTLPGPTSSILTTIGDNNDLSTTVCSLHYHHHHNMSPTVLLRDSLLPILKVALYY